MAFTWKDLEIRGARWANVLALFPGCYCGYVLWEQRHPGGAPLSKYPGFIFSVAIFMVCIFFGALLNILRSRAKGGHKADRLASPPLPLPMIAPEAPAKTAVDEAESDVGSLLGLSGELCAFLLANGHAIDPPPVYDPYAGLGDYPDDPEIRDSFSSFRESIAEAKMRIGKRGMLGEYCGVSNVGDVLTDPSVRRADDVREIIRCLVMAAGNIRENFLTGKPFVLIPVDKKPTSSPAVSLTPLQAKAVKLAQELRLLAGKGIQGRPEAEFNRMRLEYEKTFAPQVKALMFDFAEAGAGEDSTLRRFSQFADNGNDILNVARALIRLAHLGDGIDIDLRYPS